MTFTVQLEGLDRALAWLDAAPEKVGKGLEKGLYTHAAKVMAESQRIVPVGGPPTSPHDPAPGTLKASGTVLPPKHEGSTVVVELGYGGAASAYAWRQHEDLLYRHKPGQTAKYLERPLLALQDEMLETVVDAIQSEMR